MLESAAYSSPNLRHIRHLNCATIPVPSRHHILPYMFLSDEIGSDRLETVFSGDTTRASGVPTNLLSVQFVPQAKTVNYVALIVTVCRGSGSNGAWSL